MQAWEDPVHVKVNTTLHVTIHPMVKAVQNRANKEQLRIQAHFVLSNKTEACTSGLQTKLDKAGMLAERRKPLEVMGGNSSLSSILFRTLHKPVLLTLQE